jgi:hypothetical protein
MASLLLVSERHAGARSRWGPYIAMLPDALPSVAFVRPRVVAEELGGLPLHIRVRDVDAPRLRRWQDATAGLCTAHPRTFPADVFTCDAVRWAYGMYYSRAMRLPRRTLAAAPVGGGGGGGGVGGFGGFGGFGGGRKRGKGKGKEGKTGGRAASVVAQGSVDAPDEGLVPFMDSLNHTPGANTELRHGRGNTTSVGGTGVACGGGVVDVDNMVNVGVAVATTAAATTATAVAVESIELVRWRDTTEGEAIFIDYGKGNGDLLTNYGFCLGGNAGEVQGGGTADVCRVTLQGSNGCGGGGGSGGSGGSSDSGGGGESGETQVRVDIRSVLDGTVLNAARRLCTHAAYATRTGEEALDTTGATRTGEEAPDTRGDTTTIDDAAILRSCYGARAAELLSPSSGCGGLFSAGFLQVREDPSYT